MVNLGKIWREFGAITADPTPSQVCLAVVIFAVLVILCCAPMTLVSVF